MVKLDALSLADAEQVRQWRNESIQNARTPFLLTTEMQQEWYDSVVCNREARHRYWGVWHDHACDDGGKLWFDLGGIAGFTDIDGRIRTAEVALMVAPELRGKGIGGQAFTKLLDQAFGVFNLETVFGECYLCNESLGFWRHMVKKWRGEERYLPKRQYWQGRYWDSLWFCIDRSAWSKEQPVPNMVPTSPWGAQISVAGDPNY